MSEPVAKSKQTSSGMEEMSPGQDSEEYNSDLMKEKEQHFQE